MLHRQNFHIVGIFCTLIQRFISLYKPLMSSALIWNNAHGGNVVGYYKLLLDALTQFYAALEYDGLRV